MSNNNTYNHLVIFDSECLLCNNSVQFLLKKDSKNLFVFCSLKYAFENGILPTTQLFPDSVIYKKNEQIYTESTAVLELAKTLGFPYALIYIFKIIHTFIRNIPYKIIARNRYSIWGKTETCFLMKPIYKAKFLDM